MVAIKREHLWQATRTLAACGLAWGATSLCGVKETYWALITAVIVTQSDLPATSALGRDRLVGTLLGTAAGLLIIEAVKHGLSSVPLFWAALMPLALISAIWPNMRIACITLIVLILVPSAGPDFGRPIDRVAEILVGIVASIIAAAIIRFKAAE
jgi:uncharacterized membrane protein YccC